MEWKLVEQLGYNEKCVGATGGDKKMDSEVSAILISRHRFSGRSCGHREVRLSYAVKRLQKKNQWEPEIGIWLDQGRNNSAEASRGANEGLLRHSEVVENEEVDKLPNSRTRGIRATPFSVSLPKSCLKKLLGKWLEKMTLKNDRRRKHEAGEVAH